MSANSIKIKLNDTKNELFHVEQNHFKKSAKKGVFSALKKTYSFAKNKPYGLVTTK